MDEGAVVAVAVGVTVTVAALLYHVWFGRRLARLVRDWAEEAGYRLVSATPSLRLVFGARASRAFRVVVEDAAGHVLHGTLFCKPQGLVFGHGYATILWDEPTQKRGFAVAAAQPPREADTEQ